MFKKVIILIVFVFCCTFCIDPLLWPQRFSQNFIQAQYTSEKTQFGKIWSGKIWYDVKNNRQRVDLQNNFDDLLCLSVVQSYSPCSHVLMNDKLYIWAPNLNKCCQCCTKAEGCEVIKRDWLKEYQFVGEDIVNGQNCYKWTKFELPTNSSYYATTDSKNIPRRFYNGMTTDFILYTYSEEPISDSLFILPQYCETSCPKQSICSKLKEGKNKVQRNLKNPFLIEPQLNLLNEK